MFSAVFSELCPFWPLLQQLPKPNKKKIINSIGLQLPIAVEVNPDRANISFESRMRPAFKEERVMILTPFVEELKVKRSSMPLTIFYGNLEDCADSFLHFSSELGDNQYEPPDAPNVAKNGLFTQYHAQYPRHEQERIME